MPAAPAPELEIVIVSHGAKELLRNCLRALERHPASVPTRVSVVDSGSTDDTPEMVEQKFVWAEVHRMENVGFSVANNVVLRDTVAPFVLLLNPDTEVLEGSLDRSLEALKAHPEAGMVGCKLVLPGGDLDHACKRSFPTPLAALAHFSGIGRRNEAAGSLSQYRATHLGDDEAGEVDAVNGAFMLVTRTALRQVGLLDAGYWLYMEDLDWCARFWRAGWTVRYEPSATVIHVKGGSSGKRRGRRQEIAFHRGMGRFYRRFQAPDHNPLANFVVYVGIGAKLALSLTITALQARRHP